MMESKSYGILSKSISLWLYLLKLCSSSEKKNEVILDSITLVINSADSFKSGMPV